MKELLKDLQIIQEMPKLSPVVSLFFLSSILPRTYSFQREKYQSLSPAHFWGPDLFLAHR